MPAQFLLCDILISLFNRIINKMENKKRLIIYTIAIITVSALVFMSQQTYFNNTADKNLFSNISASVYDRFAEGVNWVTDKAYPTLVEESQRRGEMAKNAIDEQKEKISENVLEKVGNYFSGIKNSIINPGSPQNCPAN